MNILIVLDRYYPIGGGIQQYVRGLSGQLSLTGHAVTILTQAIKGQPDKEEYEEGVVVRSSILQDALPEPATVLNRWPHLAEMIRGMRPDVVYANNHSSAAAITACGRLGIPVVYCCHGWGLLCPLKIRFLKPDNALCYNERSVEKCSECYKKLHLPSRVTGISTLKQYLKIKLGSRKDVSMKVAQYDQFQEILESADTRIVLSRKWLPFFDKKNTFSITLGIDTDFFRHTDPTPFLQKYGVEGKYILVTSRIHSIKGQDWAIRALNYLPEVIKLVIAGNTSLFSGPKEEDNPHTQRVRRIVEESGLKDRIVFTGFLDTEEMIQAYSGAVATLVPSVWLEPFGYVTAEAMACKCPVVITANCGSADLVTDGVEGYVVPRMDPKAMADAVLKILPHREEMGKAARDKVVWDLNWPKISMEVLKVFEAAAANDSTRRS